MKINIFRVGRWLEALLSGLWTVGCLFYYASLATRNAERSILLTTTGFVIGMALIMLVSWGIGWTMRRLLRIPPGRDFRDDQAEAF